ncbi:MAG: nucleoside hydrolase [Verrucomicrobiota bacterium]
MWTFFCLGCVVGSPLLAKPIPVVLDTDIGSDIDDTWALYYLLQSPELDLKMVLTDTADTSYRARVAAKFLTECGRMDVAVGIGVPGKKDAEFQLPYVTDYELSTYSGLIHEDGVQALIEMVHASEEPITLIALGPVPNLRVALERDPTIAAKMHYIGMQGSIDLGYGKGAASAEWNVASHIADFRAVLGADWQSFKITPLDTCGFIKIEGEAYQSLKQSELLGLKAVFENYDYWEDLVTWEKPDYVEHRTSTLYDIVPIYMAYSGELLEYEQMRIVVDDEGFTRRSEEGHLVDVAMRWKDLDAFYSDVVARLLKE